MQKIGGKKRRFSELSGGSEVETRGKPRKKMRRNSMDCVCGNNSDNNHNQRLKSNRKRPLSALHLNDNYCFDGCKRQRSVTYQSNDKPSPFVSDYHSNSVVAEEDTNTHKTIEVIDAIVNNKTNHTIEDTNVSPTLMSASLSPPTDMDGDTPMEADIDTNTDTDTSIEIDMLQPQKRRSATDMIFRNRDRRRSGLEFLVLCGGS